VDAKNAGVDPEHPITPPGGELGQVQSGTVREVQEPVLAGRHPPQGSHEARDSRQVLTGRPSRQAEGHPQEALGSGACGT
jgi:hypothetical protein